MDLTKKLTIRGINKIKKQWPFHEDGAEAKAKALKAKRAMSKGVHRHTHTHTHTHTKDPDQNSAAQEAAQISSQERP